MKRASYRHAVDWIAETDEPTVMDEDEISGFISVLLAADLFDVDPVRVARDVLRRRQARAKAKRTVERALREGAR